MQDKATFGKQLTIHLEDLETLQENAIKDSMKIPVFTLTFPGQRYYAVTEEWFLSILNGEHLDDS